MSKRTITVGANDHSPLQIAVMRRFRHIDPYFVAPRHWADPNDLNAEADPNDPHAVWTPGDYHLKSQAGHWDATSRSWVLDEITSLCIDAGDPASLSEDEPAPNGARISRGAYGGTPEASKSLVTQQ